MADYAIYGTTNKSDLRMILINESDWTVEADVYPTPYISGQQYMIECTAGQKLIVAIETDGASTAMGNITAVLKV